jgi:hypothetical protein
LGKKEKLQEKEKKFTRRLSRATEGVVISIRFTKLWAVIYIAHITSLSSWAMPTQRQSTSPWQQSEDTSPTSSIPWLLGHLYNIMGRSDSLFICVAVAMLKERLLNVDACFILHCICSWTGAHGCI